MDETTTKAGKPSNSAIIYIVLLFIILIFTGCSSSNPIVYTPTPQPESTPPSTPLAKEELSGNNSYSTSAQISDNKEYNYNYPVPDLIGNTGANINNGGLCVYDNTRVYYIDDGIYSVTRDGIDQVKILDMQNISCLNDAGEYLYFLSNHDGGIYRVKKQENAEPEYMMIDGAKSLIIIDDSLYYSCGMSEGNTNMVYRTHLGGTSQECLFFKANSLYPDNSYMYFDNIDDDNKLYRYDTISGKITKMTDDKAEQINIVNNHIYYISEDKSFNVVRMDRNGENTMVVVSEPCTNLNSRKNELIYTPVKTGYIKSYDIITGDTDTLLEYSDVSGMCIANTIIFFETMVVKGNEPEIYYYNLKNDTVNKPLPQNIYGYIKEIDFENNTILIYMVKVYTEQEAIEMYAKNNDITIEHAKEQIYNEQGTYYIYDLVREPVKYEYLDWTRVIQKRKPTSLNVSTPYVSSISGISDMYDSNEDLQSKLIYSFVILNNEILEIEELFYPVDFYS